MLLLANVLNLNFAKHLNALFAGRVKVKVYSKFLLGEIVMTTPVSQCQPTCPSSPNEIYKFMTRRLSYND